MTRATVSATVFASTSWFNESQFHERIYSTIELLRFEFEMYEVGPPTKPETDKTLLEFCTHFVLFCTEKIIICTQTVFEIFAILGGGANFAVAPPPKEYYMCDTPL